MTLYGIPVANIASGIRSGYGNVRGFFSLKEKNVLFERDSFMLRSTWRAAKTSLKISRMFPTDPSLIGYRIAAIALPALLVFSNTLAWGLNAHQVEPGLYADTYKFSEEKKSGVKHFLCHVWAATPYLLLITNVALTVLECSQNPTKAILSFTFATLAAADHYKYLPEGISWLLNDVLPLPTATVALCYGSWTTRAIISVEIVANLFRKS